MIERLRPAARLSVDDDDNLLAAGRYSCPCGREARLPLAALADLAAVWSRAEDPHFPPEIAKRFAAAESALLDHHAGAFLVQITCACGAPASLVLGLVEQAGVERVRVYALLADGDDAVEDDGEP